MTYLAFVSNRDNYQEALTAKHYSGPLKNNYSTESIIVEKPQLTHKIQHELLDMYYLNEIAHQNNGIAYIYVHDQNLNRIIG